MKKQIGFYIGWDVILFIIINLNSLYEFKLKEMNLRMQVSTGALGWCYVALLLLIGFWFFVLIFFNRKTEMTRKRAICELVCIGVPSLYLATYRAIIFSLLQIYHNLSVLYPYSLTKILGLQSANMVGGILLSYELCIFIVRMIDIQKSKKEKEANKIAKEV